MRGTPDGYLIALNADTGAPLWARQVAKPAEGETFTMAPRGLRGSRADRSGRQREQPAGLGRRVPRRRRIAGVALQHRAEAGRARLRDVEEPEGNSGGRRRRSGRRSRSTPRTAICTSPSRIRRPICPSTSARATTSTPTRSSCSTSAPGSCAGIVSSCPTTRTTGTSRTRRRCSRTTDQRRAAAAGR